MPPNIIYILGDDHRAEQIGCCDHPIMQTPNLDRLAREGVLFENAFCTSPLCTPSRVSHYTGQWERTHGVNFNSGSSLSPEAWEQSFPHRLKEAGYFLGWVGKNHVPAGQGGYGSGYLEGVFDYWYGNHEHSGFYPKEMARMGGGIYKNAQLDTQVEVFAEGVKNFLEPDAKFLESCSSPLPARPASQPFCLCVTFNLPHAYGCGTMQLRPEDGEIYKSLYRDRFDEIPLPSTYVAAMELVEPRLPPHVWNGQYIPSYDYVRMPRTLRERRIREYQAIFGMDRFLGNLRAMLERLELAQNTVIVFSTDHGIHHGEHGIGGKSFLYEEDVRIPLIIYDPRLPAQLQGRRCSEMVAVPDLAPTVLGLCGIETPLAMQGSSLEPLLRGESLLWRDALFTEQLMDIQNYPRSESVRTAEWKYVRYFARTEDPNARGLYRGTLDNYRDCLDSSLEGELPIYEELYRLSEDPYEEKNLASDSVFASVMDELRGKLLVLGREARGAGGEPKTLPYA